MALLEYAAGSEPEWFIELAERLLDAEQVSCCIDIGHVGMRQASARFNRCHPGLSLGALSPEDGGCPTWPGRPGCGGWRPARRDRCRPLDRLARQARSFPPARRPSPHPGSLGSLHLPEAAAHSVQLPGPAVPEHDVRARGPAVRDWAATEACLPGECPSPWKFTRSKGGCRWLTRRGSSRRCGGPHQCRADERLALGAE